MKRVLLVISPLAITIINEDNNNGECIDTSIFTPNKPEKIALFEEENRLINFGKQSYI